MRTHQEIDRRSLRLAQSVAARIDADPQRRGLAQALQTCARWHRRAPAPAYREWLVILDKPWAEVRRVLLDPSEEGCRLRQSSPFCGILAPRERWDIYREFRDHDAATA